jgi:GNAT superfamily N-acetyltransferase
LTDWLQRKALKGQLSHSAKTYVVCAGTQVVAFYSLATGAMCRGSTPRAALRRNMPDPIPAVVLARLAVHQAYEGQGIGGALLRDAVFRFIDITEVIGARLLVCHAIDESAKQFDLKHDFEDCPLDSALTVVLSREDAVNALRDV